MTAQSAPVPQQTSKEERILIKYEEAKHREERKIYEALPELLNNLSQSFTAIHPAISTIDTAEQFKALIANGGKIFLEKRLEEGVGKDLKMGAFKMKPEALMDNLQINDPGQFLNAVGNASLYISKHRLSLDYLNVENGNVSLNDSELDAHLKERWSYYLIDPQEIETYKEYQAFAEAAGKFQRMLLKRGGMNLCWNSVNQFLQAAEGETTGNVQNFIPRLPFEAPWKWNPSY